MDDIELAKTAGSPAFFAPEMCYTGVEDDTDTQRSISPQTTTDVPAFTLRPPSTAEDLSMSRPLSVESWSGVREESSNLSRHSFGRESTFSRPHDATTRTGSTTTIPRKNRLPITNAIDVWALGVTLYCLLFGKTPFDAPNEYLLMQAIPTVEVDIPRYFGSDKISSDGPSPQPQEVEECVDLLKRLLEKDPSKRISLDQAKVSHRSLLVMSLAHCRNILSLSAGYQTPVHGSRAQIRTNKAMSPFPATRSKVLLSNPAASGIGSGKESSLSRRNCKYWPRAVVSAAAA